MERRFLGSTGEVVSAIGLGGAHVAEPRDPSETIRLIHAAVDAGITFMDNCWDYHDGDSEVRMGNALAQGGMRERVFLMTKIDGHTRRVAEEQIDDSLRRLRTSYVDLMQLHEMIRPEDPGKVFAPGGAIEALVRARDAGKVRYVGFTGHKDPEIHLQMLNYGFKFDAVQMPLNVADYHYRSFEKAVLPVLVERGIGVLGMKPLAYGRLAGVPWITPTECLRYALSLPTSVVITGCSSMRDIRQAIDVAHAFSPMSNLDMARLRDRASKVDGVSSGAFERYKTTDGFDATTANPHWVHGNIDE